MTTKYEQIKTDNLIRKTIFLFPQILALFGLYKGIWEIAVLATLLATIFVGVLFFRLVEEINNERLNK